MENILTIENISKYYGNKSNLTKAISNISLNINKGDFVAIMGASGSGKTTLLNVISTIDKVTSGHIYVEGLDITKLKGNNLNKFRREELGFIFQDFNLLDTFSIKDNIFLPLVLSKEVYPVMNQKLKVLAPKLGIQDLLEKYPYQISGGQKQRVAVARALITHPQIVLADEPTGALDSKSTDQLLEIFDSINEEGQTILMVTHSTKAASYAKRVLFIRDGEVFHQIYKGNQTNQQMYQSISDTLTLLAAGGK